MRRQTMPKLFMRGRCVGYVTPEGVAVFPRVRRTRDWRVSGGWRLDTIHLLLDAKAIRIEEQDGPAWVAPMREARLWARRGSPDGRQAIVPDGVWVRHQQEG